MKEASINLKQYPWYDQHAVAVRTITRFSGLEIEDVLAGLHAKFDAHQRTESDSTPQRKAA